MTTTTTTDTLSTETTSTETTSTESTIAQLDQISQLASQAVTAQGFALYDLHQKGGTLQVLVTTQPNPAAAKHNAAAPDASDLTQISRSLSRLLDEQNLQSFTLEVSTPGLERKLTKPEHFATAVGETVTVKLTHSRVLAETAAATETAAEIETRRIEGELQSADQTSITISLAHSPAHPLAQPSNPPITINLADISSARTVFAWGSSKSKKSSATSSKKSATSSKKGAAK